MKRSLIILCIVALGGMPAFAQETATPAASPQPAAIEPTDTTAKPEAAAPAPQNKNLAEALGKLAPEKAQMIDETLRKNLLLNQDKQKKLRSLFIDMRTILLAPTYDAAAFATKSEQARVIQSEIRKSLDDAISQSFSKLDAAERKIVFDALPARYRRDTE